MKLLITIVIVLISGTGMAQLQLARIFTSHMVLQRDQPIHLWGSAPAGVPVTVTLGSEALRTQSRADGNWEVIFPARKASAKPVSLAVTTDTERLVLDDILLGDLWLCIGQSNMEWPMAREMHYEQARQQAHQSLIRFYNPNYAGKNIYGTVFTDSVAGRLTPERFYEGSWQRSDTNTIATMSAVAWHFAKRIADTLSVPIGLIQLSIGGAPLETFIDENTLAADPAFAAKVKGNWLHNEALPEWVRNRGRQNSGNLTTIATDANGPAHGYKPGFAFNASIAPITHMPIKGILCYQGESNAQEEARVMEYASLCSLMVADYRKKWHQPNLPFYYVQLSSIDTVQYKGQWWPVFRDEQRKMLSMIPHSGMAVCSDIGFRHDVHPTNKKLVGERLAAWALFNTYRMSIVPSGPLPRSANYRGGKMTIRFDYATSKLGTADGQALRGFSLDGIHEVAATIHQQTVSITTDKKPVFVYYGWKSFTDANLVNAAHLPASTFRIKVN